MKDCSNGVLRSVGDRFPDSVLRVLHSRFGRIVNFSFGSRVVSVTIEPQLAGAHTVVLDGALLENLHSIYRLPDRIILNDKDILFYDEQMIFVSGLPATDCTIEGVKTFLPLLRQELISGAKENSLVFLLSEGTSTDPSASSFEREMKKRLRNAYLALLKGDIRIAAAGFKGTGYGLTPSGDDFLAGLLRGLSFIEFIDKAGEQSKSQNSIKRHIYELALSDNPLSNTFFDQAYNGSYDYGWKVFLTELMTTAGRDLPLVERNRDSLQNCESLKSSFARLISKGETSGEDTMTGFISAFELC